MSRLIFANSATAARIPSGPNFPNFHRPGYGLSTRFSRQRIIYGFTADFCETDAPMNPLIKLLLEGGGLSTAQMAQVLNLTEAEVNRQLDQLKKDRLLLGWRPVLNLAEEDAGVVRAVIEVKITPERGGGFNRLAERISRFDEVESCYLMSGGFDLLVFVNGSSLQKVAGFVSEKLSTIEGVLSTATHFLLRTYKEQGFLLDVKAEENDRLKVTP
jgi:DNA-binding Lrp family transcriptional regulator